MPNYKAELILDGLPNASVYAPTKDEALQAIMYYAAQYADEPWENTFTVKVTKTKERKENA